MCDSKGKWLSFFTGGLASSLWLNPKSYKNAVKKDQAAIQAANEAAQRQVELNKQANAVQTTDESQATTASETKKLTTQKVPLNTASTGATIGSATSVGLNLGGY